MYEVGWREVRSLLAPLATHRSREGMLLLLLALRQGSKVSETMCGEQKQSGYCTWHAWGGPAALTQASKAHESFSEEQLKSATASKVTRDCSHLSDLLPCTAHRACITIKIIVTTAILLGKPLFLILKLPGRQNPEPSVHVVNYSHLLNYQLLGRL